MVPIVRRIAAPLADTAMLTVVLSTFNGSATLPRMLEALGRLTQPSTGVEFIAVDNGSTDRTRAIIEQACASLPLRVLQQPLRGKNRALNLALSAAEGDLLVFTDDDTLPAPDWLLRLQQAAATESEFDIFGGAIRPDWPCPVPSWIQNGVPLGLTYGATRPEQARGEVFPGLIWGANMMVRRRVFESGLRFNEHVGPSAGQYVMGSETEFNLRAAAAGFKCFFEPDAVVQHIIRPHQMEREWVLQRAYRFGRNMWNQEQRQPGPPVPMVMGMPRWRFRVFAENLLQAGAHRLRGNRDAAFKHEWEVRFLRGYFAQWWCTR